LGSSEASRVPAGVRETAWWSRVRRPTFSSFSSSAMLRLKAGWLMNRSRAASVKLSVLATA
jgi:hypothetical protein